MKLKQTNKSEDLSKGEQFLRFGQRNYNDAVEMEEGNSIDNLEITEERIDASWRLAAGNFWQAFVLGNLEAPLWLFKCFSQGVGVQQDDYIAKLMFGTALKLNDPECHKIRADRIPKVPESMKPEIEKLVKFIQATNAKIPSQGVSMEVVSQQMTIFDETIKLPSGKSLLKCFLKNGNNHNDQTNYNTTPHSNPYDDTHDLKQKKVPLVGQDNPPAKEGCEIS